MEKMSRPLPLNPTFIPPPYGVLRSLLENPLKLPLHHEDAFCKDKDKEKKLDDESNSPTVPQSAFLGPTLWDKTLPYDGDTFQLEYMDLEEFLSENGIPPSPSQHDHSPHPPGLQPTSSAAPSVMDLSSRASAPLHPGIPSPNCMQSPIRPGKLSEGSPFRWGAGQKGGACGGGIKNNGEIGTPQKKSVVFHPQPLLLPIK